MVGGVVPAVAAPVEEDGSGMLTRLVDVVELVTFPRTDARDLGVEINVLLPVRVDQHQFDLFEHVEDSHVLQHPPPFVGDFGVLPDRRWEDVVFARVEQVEEQLDLRLVSLGRKDDRVDNLTRSSDLGASTIHLGDDEGAGEAQAVVLCRCVVDDGHQTVGGVGDAIEVVRKGTEVDGVDAGECDQLGSHRFCGGQSSRHFLGPRHGNSFGSVMHGRCFT